MTCAPLLAADLLTLAFSIGLASTLLGAFSLGLGSNPLSLLQFLSPILFGVFFLFELYPGTGLNPVIELRSTTVGVALVFAVFIVASLFYATNQTLVLTTAFVLTVTLVPLVRSLTRSICSRFRWWGQPVVIFGSGETGVAQFDFFKANPRLGFRPLGVVDESPPRPEHTSRVPYLGGFDRARAIAEAHNVFWAIVAMPERGAEQVHEVVSTRIASFWHAMVVSEVNGLPSLWNRASDCGGLSGIHVSTNVHLPLPRMIKRLMDVVLVTIGGVACLPLVGVIILLVRAGSKGPALYGHERIGLGAVRFKVWKFRTMVENAEEVLERHLAADPAAREEWTKTQKLRKDPRVTRVGQLLRITSLDELPQLWNVLRGEMSLVGPRPIVQAEIPRYGDCFELYGRAVPGITGLWQVSGRNKTTYARRVELDSYYVKNWSPWVDLYILARTISVVLLREGAY